MTIIRHSAILLAAAAFLVGPIAGCSKTETATGEKPSASTEKSDAAASEVSISDQWVKAADTGMTGMFGILKNAGSKEAVVVSATSPAAGAVELHEVVGEPGSATMRPKAGGLIIPAGGTHVLAPGGDHIMLMDLKQPLKAGSDVEVTLTLADGTTVPVSAQVRDYAGAAESYEPAGAEHAGGHGG
jgi:copper(I)-binding protein